MSTSWTQQGQGTPNSTTGSLFGNPSQTTSQPLQIGSLFTPPSQPTTQPTTSFLGQTPQLISQPATQPPSTASGSLFGNPPQTAIPSATSGSLFGNPSQAAQPSATSQSKPTTSLFGNQPSPTATFAPTTTATTPSTSLFGNLTTSTTGLSNPAGATTGLLGSGSAMKPTNTTSLFGTTLGGMNTSAQPQAQNSLFGGAGFNNSLNAPDGFFKSSIMAQDAISQ